MEVFSLRSSQGNAKGLNSSCVGANPTDTWEHGTLPKQSACARLAQRARRESIQTSWSPSAGTHAPPFAHKPRRKTKKPSHHLAPAKTHLRSCCSPGRLSNRIQRWARSETPPAEAGHDHPRFCSALPSQGDSGAAASNAGRGAPRGLTPVTPRAPLRSGRPRPATEMSFGFVSL